MFNWKNKKLLILGATNLLGEVVKEAKKYNAHTIAIDYFENSPAKKVSDENYLINATDINAVSELIKNKNIDGVITGFADSLLPAYNQICSKVNLPCYITEEQIKFTTDKKFFKECCAKFKIPIVKEYKKDEPIDFPVIIKPVDNSGARGISICNNQNELKNGIELALSFSKKKEYIIEQYLNCKEATIFYVFIDGRVHFALMGDRHIAPVKDGFIKLPTGYTFPSDYTEKTYNDLNNKFINMFNYLKIKNGFMFIQCFIDNVGNCVPYEPGFRLTGSFEQEILEHACGYNTWDMMINYALEGYMTEDDIENKINPYLKRKYYNLSCLIKPGTIGKFDGLGEINKLSNVIKVFPSYEIGDTLEKDIWGKLAQIALRVIFYADSENQYNKTIQEIKKYLKIISVNNENMLINTDIIGRTNV